MICAARVKNAICPFVPFRDVRELGKASDIEDDLTFSRAIKFLHEIGTIVYFDKGENKLRDIVILDPQWLTNLMGTIVTFRHRYMSFTY